MVLIGSIGPMVRASVGAPPRRRRPWVTWAARAALVVGTMLLVAVLVFVQPMSAERVTLDATASDARVTVTDGATEFRMAPAAPLRTGLASYPGARVDPRSYAQVLRPVAEAGYPVVVHRQPVNLATLSVRAGDSVIGDVDDEVDRWVIGGHSLGGAMVASSAESERAEPAGLLLYVAFPASDISDRAGLEVASVPGANVELADLDDIAASVPELPPETVFVAIDGAIHSFSSDYGPRRGDGTATITREDAQDQIVAATLEMMRLRHGRGTCSGSCRRDGWPSRGSARRRRDHRRGRGSAGS